MIWISLSLLLLFFKKYICVYIHVSFTVLYFVVSRRMLKNTGSNLLAFLCLHFQSTLNIILTCNVELVLSTNILYVLLVLYTVMRRGIMFKIPVFGARQDCVILEEQNLKLSAEHSKHVSTFFSYQIMKWNSYSYSAVETIFVY